MNKMSMIYKISYSALFIALGIILSRFVSLPYLFGLPFLKVSFSPSVVMFSSFYLGPLWGFLVGTAVDVFGALIYPTGGAFNPLYTVAASLTGLIPYLAYRAIKFTRLDNKFPILLGILMGALNIFTIIFMIFNDTIKSESGKTTYTLYPWIKWSVCSVLLALSVVFLIAMFFIKKKFSQRKFNENYNLYIVASSVYVTYFFFKIPVGSLVQALLLNWNFWMIFIVRTLTGFLTTFVHIIIICLALDLSLRFNMKGALLEPTFFEKRKNKQNNLEEEKPEEVLQNE